MPNALLAIASIRRATRHRHSALEAVLQLVPPLDPARYLFALRGFDLFLSVWEPRIDAVLPAALRQWFGARSRRGLLRRDLELLDGGRIAEPGDHVACEQAVAGIVLTSAAATFGSIYVLEGSALGGQVIARDAMATLGLDAGHGAAYFNGQGAETAGRWASFRALLEDQVGPAPAPRAQACTAAVQTFDALIATFTRLHRDHARA